MNILAFDTSTSACSVALLHGDSVQEIHQVAPKLHAQLILSMVDELLSTNGLTLADLDVIAYGCGPGSLTGIRLASSVAQGLGFASGRPLMPISSLAILAQSAYLEKKWTKIAVAVDARMNQIYWGLYQINEHHLVELIGQETLSPLDAVSLPSDRETWCGIGDGWEKLECTLNCINSSQLPRASALLMLAKATWSSGTYQGIPARDAVPTYLR